MRLSWQKFATIGLSAIIWLGRVAAQDDPFHSPTSELTGRIPLLKVAEYHMLERRFAPAAVAAGDYVYIIGGIGGAHGEVLKSIERFDPKTGRSEEFAKLKTARFWHRAVSANGKIYILGGRSAGPPPGVTGAQPVIDFMQAPEETRINYMARAVNLRDVVPLFYEKSVEILDVATGQITAGPDMPEPREQFACVVVGQKLYVVGGRQPDGNHLSTSSTSFVLDLSEGKWGPDVPPPATAQSVAVPDHDLFLLGDYASPDEILAYDPVTKQSETFTLQSRQARHGALVAHADKIYAIGGRESKVAKPLDLIQVFVRPPAKSIAPP